MLSNERSIMSSIKGSNVVDDCKQNIFVIRLRHDLLCFTFSNISASRDERRHVDDFWKINSCWDLLVEPAGVFKPFQMKWGNHRKFLKRTGRYKIHLKIERLTKNQTRIQNLLQGESKKMSVKEMFDFLTLKMLPLALALIKTKNCNLFDPLVKNCPFSMKISL